MFSILFDSCVVNICENSKNLPIVLVLTYLAGWTFSDPSRGHLHLHTYIFEYFLLFETISDKTWKISELDNIISSNHSIESFIFVSVVKGKYSETHCWYFQPQNGNPLFHSLLGYTRNAKGKLNRQDLHWVLSADPDHTTAGNWICWLWGRQLAKLLAWLVPISQSIVGGIIDGKLVHHRM